MKPLDPRLLKYARAARGYLVLTVATGLATAGLVVAQAIILAHTLGGAVQEGLTLNGAATAITWLVIVVAARAVSTTIQERFAHRAATNAINELRERIVEHGARLGPRWLASGRGPALVTLATRGLENLEPYFMRYLPQLVLAATLTPITLVVVFSYDWLSAVIVAIAVPLIPLFMILIGLMTVGASERGLKAMERLGAQVLDLIAGLPTLRAFGRQAGPAARVQALGEAHRRATMGTLRIAFLSGMVLELLATFGVALVAVTIGFRLLFGQTDLITALAVLILAPEVFNPLRQVGTQFHASTDGVAAANAAFEILETPLPTTGTATSPDLHQCTLSIEKISVRSTGGWTPHDLSLTLTPGQVTALVGPSGIGKSSTVDVLLGLLNPDLGQVRIIPSAGAPVPLSDLDLATYWSQITWLPQRPFLEPGTIRELLGSPAPAALAAAAALTGLDQVVEKLRDGWDTQLGFSGHGLSVGQRQRVALTRALLSHAAVVILDEPTAHLDAAGEHVVLNTVAALRDNGAAVLLIAHRPSLVATADHIVTVNGILEEADDQDGSNEPTATQTTGELR